MVSKLRVGVIFGGRSGEHEISIRSATAVIQNLDSERYEVIPIAISKSGRWLSSGESAAMLPASAARCISRGLRSHSEGSVILSGDPSSRGIVTLNKQSRKLRKVDVLLPILHGTFGEDGTIQGLFEMSGIPYVGCGVLASSCGMDKAVMKTLFIAAGLPICKYIWFRRSDWERNPKSYIRKIESELGFPCFVKPANLGSSVGISRVDDSNSLKGAVALAARYDRKIIVEEGLNAREIECGVIGNDHPVASLPGEYIVKDPAAQFLDYTEKYSSTGNVQFVVPAPLSKKLTAQIQSMATRAFKSIDGSGLARVDFFLKKDSGELLLNEVNTMPGLTDVSGFPRMWADSGLGFSAMLDKLIDLAFDAHAEKARNETSFV